MKPSRLLSISCLLLVSAFVQAAEEKPSMSATYSDTLTATVMSIDHESRAVTLETEDGRTVSFVASEEVRNLPQVSAGDVVVASYVEEVSIQVVAAENAEAAVAQLTVAARAKEGDMPGAGIVDTQVEVATVEAIDLVNNTFKLKFVDGNIGEYTARNPENLKRSAVGDVVVARYTQALALSVEKVPAE